MTTPCRRTVCRTRRSFPHAHRHTAIGWTFFAPRCTLITVSCPKCSPALTAIIVNFVRR